MDNLIFFIAKMRGSVGVLLEEAGFEIVYSQHRPFESIRYERKIDTQAKSDLVSFHGLEQDYDHNYIYSDVVSGKKELAFRPLRTLSDNYDALKWPDTERWSYNSEEELEAVLSEICDLLEHKLFKWFDDPIMPAISKLSSTEHEEQQANLRKQIATYEEIAHDLYAKGESNEAKRFEEAAKQYRKHHK